jgi:hypothetical protein
MGAGERGIAARGHALVDRLISWPVGQGGKIDVQRCKAERSSCAKVAYESIEYGVLSIGGCPVSGGRWQPRVAGGENLASR